MTSGNALPVVGAAQGIADVVPTAMSNAAAVDVAQRHARPEQWSTYGSDPGGAERAGQCRRSGMKTHDGEHADRLSNDPITLEALTFRPPAALREAADGMSL